MFLTPSQLTSLTGKQRYGVRADLWQDEFAWLDLSPGQRYAWMAEHHAQFVKTFDEITAAKVPPNLRSFPSAPGVYFLFFDGVLQYVGKSVCLSSRLAQHLYPDPPALIEADWFNSVSWVIAPSDFIDHLEGYYMRAFRPRRNIRPGGLWPWGKRRG